MAVVEDSEVIIIGGGAAGTSAAINLARRGRHVLLLEGRTPRPAQLGDLHSGEVLSPGSQRELARLGLTRPAVDDNSSFLERWALQEWDTVWQQWPGGRTTRDRLPGGASFGQINRGRFYAALQDLARASGVEVRTGWRVTDLLTDADGFCRGVVGRRLEGGQNQSFSLRAPVVVDASGRNSVVLARRGLRQPEPQVQRAAYLFFFEELAGLAPEPGVWQQFWLPGGTTLRGSQLAPRLYRYSFEMNLTERDQWLARFGRLPPYELFIRVLQDLAPEHANRFAEAKKLPHSLAFAPIGYRVRQIAHDGLLLVGDAAGYLDPSTGQGIEFALRMGRLAAGSLDEAFRRNHFDRQAFGTYLAGREAEVQPVLRNLRWLLRCSRQSWLLDTVGKVGPLRQSLTRQLVTPQPALE